MSKSKLTFKQLADIFNDHAIDLGKSKDKTARFRATNYARTAGIFESTPKKLVTESSIAKLDITLHMKEKAMLVLSKGTIFTSKSRSRSKSKSSSRSKSRSKSLSHSPNKNTLIKDLTKIMGIGVERAKALIDLGMTSTIQLKSKKYYSTLPEETKLFLAMKPDQKIPHEYIKKLEPILTGLSDASMKIILVGSYRRKKPFSSDIDCMIVADDPVLDSFLNKLKSVLGNDIHTYSKGTDKISTIINLQHIIKSKTPIVYKLDAFRTNISDEIPMLLYSTGSKEFNVIMRSIAKKKGYLLNQKGLFKDGKRIPNLNTEKAYFDVLGMVYKEPSER